MYSRYAESGRVNWMRNLALHLDPAHKNDWPVIVNSAGLGLILKSIKVDYKFVCLSRQGHPVGCEADG